MKMFMIEYLETIETRIEAENKKEALEEFNKEYDGVKVLSIKEKK